jgi:hypothetical protein
MTELLPEHLRYRKLFFISGVCAFIIVLCLIGDFFVYSIIPNTDSSKEIMNLFIENPIKGLLFFDLLGMIAYLLFIPFILSLFVLLKNKEESIMLIGTVMFFIGITMFFATNTGFSILRLSREFAAIQSGAQLEYLLSSVKTMNTLFDVQAFMISYVIVSIAWLLISVVMLKSNIFSKVSSYAGIIAGASAIIAEIFENTYKVLYEASIVLYFIALVAILVWVLSIGLLLIRLSNTKAQILENKQTA